jgi:hypothetical protein
MLSHTFESYSNNNNLLFVNQTTLWINMVPEGESESVIQRTDNTMSKRKGTKQETMVIKTIQIEQH